MGRIRNMTKAIAPSRQWADLGSSVVVDVNKILKISLFCLLASFKVAHAADQNSQQDLRRMATEGPELIERLSANSWQLVGQAVSRKEMDDSEFQVSTMSLAVEREGDAHFLDSLNLPNDAEVYYELTSTLRMPDLNRHLVVPRQIQFDTDEKTLIIGQGSEAYAMGYRLEFPLDTPDSVYLFLETVIEEDRSLIHGNIRFVGDELHLVQSTHFMEFAWIFRKIQD